MFETTKQFFFFYTSSTIQDIHIRRLRGANPCWIKKWLSQSSIWDFLKIRWSSRLSHEWNTWLEWLSHMKHWGNSNLSSQFCWDMILLPFPVFLEHCLLIAFRRHFHCKRLTVFGGWVDHKTAILSTAKDAWHHGSLNVPIEHHPTIRFHYIGIWSIMATIRWCPIYPKWDI